MNIPKLNMQIAAISALILSVSSTALGSGLPCPSCELMAQQQAQGVSGIMAAPMNLGINVAAVVNPVGSALQFGAFPQAPLLPEVALPELDFSGFDPVFRTPFWTADQGFLGSPGASVPAVPRKAAARPGPMI